MRSEIFKTVVSYLLATALVMTAGYWVAILLGSSPDSAWRISVIMGSVGLFVDLPVALFGKKGLWKKKNTAAS